jgi:hypothetical protein
MSGWYHFLVLFPNGVKSNLCTATFLGTQKFWLLLTGGPCSEEAYNIKIEIGPLKWWPL